MIDTLPDFSLLSNEMILLCTLVALASGLAAALLATLVTWLIRDRKTTQLRHELQQLSEQYQRLYDANEITALELRETKQKLGSQLETQQAKYQQQALEFVRVTERLSERNEQLAQQEQQHALQRQEFEHQRQEFEKRVDALRQNEQLLKSELATIKEARQQEQHSAADKLATLQDAREQLTKEFENISNKIFEQKTKQFSEQSQLGLTGLLTPFKEQLEGLKKKVEDVHMVDVRDRTTLKTQIDELHKLNQQMSNEAHALTTALRGEKKTQGNWGEMVLETVLKKSGLREGEEFTREQTLHNNEGKRFRPDVIINLPDNKHIVIDSKVSLNAYTDYVNSDDDQQRLVFAKAHTEAIRQHIKSLSDKAYQQLENIHSPDFVFMFMPVEPAFMLAFQHDDSVFNEAFERRIVIVTPTTLLATLRTVASIWSIERRNKSTEKLAEQAGKVYDKLVIVVERMETLGKQLVTVNNTYDETWKSLQSGRGNLLSQASQFTKLGVRVKKTLATSLVNDANESHHSESPFLDSDESDDMDDLDDDSQDIR